jgi:hypothetical protein
MSHPAAATSPPRLFVIEGQARGSERSLNDVVLAMLRTHGPGSCLVCDGRTYAVAGGARCDDCGAELVGNVASGELRAA